MAHAPVIILTFANDTTRYLHFLKEERRGILRALGELDRKEFIRLKDDAQTDTQDVSRLIREHNEMLHILHYGGHAQGEFLLWEDGTGHSGGLAKLLNQCPNLKLVFLNGCATISQVRQLIEAGVPAVIATQVVIEDHKAVEFATIFYEALANRRTIRQAYSFAVGHMQLKFGPQTMNEGIRGLEQEDESEIFPWGLYVGSSSKEVLNYSLPTYRELKLPSSFFQSLQSFPANKFLLSVLDHMCRYNPDIYSQMVEQRGDTFVLKDSSRFPSLIIENFPWPIGSQIRLLHLKTKPNVDRLRALFSTYFVTAQFLYFIRLSELWDMLHEGENPTKPVIPQLMNPNAYQESNFLTHLINLGKSNGFDSWFIPEMAELVNQLEKKQSPQYKAWQYLESLREKVAQQVVPEIETVCLNAEKSLTVLLAATAFLARFRLMTIRNVLVEYPRFSELEYELDMGALNATESVHLRLYKDPEYRRKPHFANSRSVVLTTDENALHHALNLSPFIMDANTFAQIKNSQNTEEDAEDVANIFLLGWEEKERLIYLTVNHDLFTALENKRGTDQMHTQLRQSDFSEGTNLGGEEFDLGFDFGMEEEKSEESPLVFGLLYEQYQLFQADME